MRMRRIVVGAIALSGVLAACSADETDYKEAAEKAIREHLEKTDEDAEADCEDPARRRSARPSTAPGPRAALTFTYVAEIDKKDHVLVTPTEGAPTEVPAEEETEDTATEEESES